MSAHVIQPATPLFAELAARQPLLARAGWAMLLLLLACVAGTAFDPRSFNGVSVWVKPAKFAASFVAWFWTMAWAWSVLAPAARSGLAARVVLWGTLGAAWFEQGWITWRAALGQPSHFATDALGAIMYGLMGLGAVTLVALAAVLGALVLLRGDPAQPRPWRHAVGLGLVIAGLIGGFTGASISAHAGPRIGGTPGDAANFAPFFWSRDGGDLRVAHFLGIHAMQALPALALLGAGAGVVWLGAAGWTALSLGAWVLARGGVPLFTLTCRMGATIGVHAARVTDENVPLRRGLFGGLVAAIALLLLWLTWRALAPGGVNLAEALILLCVLLTVPWAALSAGNSIVGLAILLASRDPPAFVLPALRRARPGPPGAVTALAVCIRNEDMGAVLPPLGRLLDGLDAGGAGDRFRLWLLSDTQDPAAAAAEAEAIAGFAAGRPGVQYRRRTDNAGFKAGNVMDFLDHHAGDAAFLITLDADSVMTPRATLRLVAIMEAEPKLAIVQQSIVGCPATAAFPRLFQFGMRAGMRAWATGQAWWQLDAGPYWGHNAILRCAPFRTHARLEPLPDGSRILSHDMVEAVRLQAAGWRVRCLPEEDGSLEANPPAMPEFLRRDERWGAGNMQYWQLLRLPNLTSMGRLQLVQAILLFLGAPLYAALLLLAALNAWTGGGAATPMGALGLAVGAHWLCYFAPKLAGYAQALIRREVADRYGGRAAFARGAAAELAFMQLFEPLSTLNKALFLATLPFGRRTGWAPQNRADRGIAWTDAARLLWPHSLAGLVLMLAFAGVSWAALLIALPFMLGMVLAVPLCVWSADPRVSAWLRARRIAATPEELEADAASPSRP